MSKPEENQTLKEQIEYRDDLLALIIQLLTNLNIKPQEDEEDDNLQTDETRAGKV